MTNNTEIKTQFNNYYIALFNSAVSCFNSHDISLMRNLINGGADINALNDFGVTQLHQAAEEGEKKLVQYLTSWGANVNVLDGNGNTPLQRLMEHYHKVSIKKIIKIIDILIKHGADIYCKNNHNDTLLHLSAARSPFADILSYLCEKGLDINAVNNNGKTPLTVALLHGNIKTLGFFINKNNVNNIIDTQTGRCPLHIAALNGKFTVVKWLLHELKADITPIDNLGKTPFCLAHDNNHNLIAHYLKVENIGVYHFVKEKTAPVLHAFNLNNFWPALCEASEEDEPITQITKKSNKKNK